MTRQIERVAETNCAASLPCVMGDKSSREKGTIGESWGRRLRSQPPMRLRSAPGVDRHRRCGPSRASRGYGKTAMRSMCAASGWRGLMRTLYVSGTSTERTTRSAPCPSRNHDRPRRESPRSAATSRAAVALRRLLAANVIGNLNLDEVMAGERCGFAHLAVHEDLEYRGRRIRCAIENLLAARMPTRRCEQAPSPIE